MSSCEKVPIYCFEGTVYSTSPAFSIPVHIKDEMGWTRSEHSLGFVIFDESGSTIWHGVHQTVSGGEFYRRELLVFRQGTKIRVALYWPPVLTNE